MKRRVILFVVWTVLIIFAMVVVGIAVNYHQQRKCGAVKIAVSQSGGDFFISENDIREYIALTADSLEGEPLGRINIHFLEDLISGNPYVKNAAVYSSIDGVVHIEVTQRKPIARVQNAAHQQWYLSEDGRMMPVSPGKPAGVLFVSGVIPEVYDPEVRLDIPELKTAADSALSETIMYKVFQIASAIDKDAFLKAQLEQLYYNREGDFELVPLVGKQLIIFGDADAVGEKFDKLKVFYQQGLPKEGWDKYDTINLKFEHQVVCTLK